MLVIIIKIKREKIYKKYWRDLVNIYGFNQNVNIRHTQLSYPVACQCLLSSLKQIVYLYLLIVGSYVNNFISPCITIL